MNGRTIGIIIGGLALAGLVGFYFFTRPDASDEVPDHERIQPKTPDLKTPNKPNPLVAGQKVKEVAPVAKPDVNGGSPIIELADQPDLPIDPMDHYPLNKQGFEAAWDEMQIEFDACRNEKGVKLDDSIDVMIRVNRESPPHEEYGIEEGEMWGMVKEVTVVGADPEAMKPFTDCVQDNLYDLLFTPPEQPEVNVKRSITFK